MRIILINLERAAERRAKMQAQLDAQGLPFEIMQATDGQKLSNDDRGRIDHNRRQAITPYLLTDNEVGCWLSHYNAIKTIAEGSAPMGCILEDDTALLPNFKTTLQAIELKIENFDFIFLHRTFKRGETFESCRAITSDNMLGRVGLMSMGCHAYIVSKAGAQKFLPRSASIAHAVDKEIHRFWSSQLDIYGLEKPIAQHADAGYSYIDETRGHHRRAERLRYPDADSTYWRARRFLTRLQDSVMKRLSFKAYVRKGRRIQNAGTHAGII